MTLPADHIAETPDEKIKVITSLLTRQIKLAHSLPVDAPTHNVRLALIGREKDYVKVSGVDEMVNLFADMKITNIFIQHFCTKGDVPSLVNNVEAGPYVFLLTDVLNWFTQEVQAHDEEGKKRLSESLAFFMVVLVKKNLMEHSDNGVELASFFLGILSLLPGLEALAQKLKNPPAVSTLSTVAVARVLFRYVCGEGTTPEEDILVMVSTVDHVIEGIDDLIAHFKDAGNTGDVITSCSFCDYDPSKNLSKSAIRLSDLITVVANMLPPPGEECDALLAQMLSFTLHVCNSNLKGDNEMGKGELLSHLVQYHKLINKNIM